LVFEDEAIKALAHTAQIANEKMEDIGARRLHTIIEKTLEDISFNAKDYEGTTLHIDKKTIHEKLDSIIEDEDSARYIL